MKRLSMDLYKQGYSCCDAIVMAANKKYKLNISDETMRVTKVINNGMGIGSLCCAIIGGVMIIGYIFGENDSKAKQLRIKFINCINCELKAINCSQICKLPISKGNCINVLSIIADILDKIISDNLEPR